MRKHLLLPAALAGLLATLAACGDETATTAPTAPTLSAAEAATLAPQFDATSHTLIDGQLVGLNASFYEGAAGEPLAPTLDRLVDAQFTITRSCPLGGEVKIEGTAQRNFVRDTRTMTSQVSATKTASGCSYALREGVTIAITGNPNIAIEASRKRVAGRPSGLQTLTHQGSFTWVKSTGESGTCPVDITATVDPEARTRTVKGTFCNRTIDRTVTWTVTTG